MPLRRRLSSAILMLLAAAGAATAIATGADSTDGTIQTYEVRLTPNWIHTNDEPASNYQNAWVYPTSPTTPFRPRGHSGARQRFLLLDPRISDAEGNRGSDEWWFVIERMWPADYDAGNHGKWGREVDFHNVAGDAGPAGKAGVGWGFGSFVSALALDWRNGAAAPSIGIEPAGLNLALPVPSRDAWHTYLVRFVAGRTDGSTVRPGAVTVWVDGNAAPTIDRPNINTVQRATASDGNSYVQQWMQLWEGDYTSDLQVAARTRMVLTRVGRTLGEALADRPVKESDNMAGQYYRGIGVNIGGPSITPVSSRLASDSRIPTSLGGTGSGSATTTTATSPTTTTATSPTTTTATSPTTTTATSPTTTSPTTTTPTEPDPTTTSTPTSTTIKGKGRDGAKRRDETFKVKAIVEANADKGVGWEGRVFVTAESLRMHIQARGIGWARFLDRHPSVTAAFGLKPVIWDGRRFFDKQTLIAHLRRKSTGFDRWAAGHAGAVAALEANAAATAPASDAATDTTRALASRVRIAWDGIIFTRSASLRDHVEAQGVDWQTFLTKRPSIARKIGAPSIRWMGTTVYTRRAMSAALERVGSSFASWAKRHPVEAARLY